jgi:hypothetical protein
MPKIEEQEKIIEEIRNAILNEGPRPDYHKVIMEKHRLQWPTLWNALDKLIKSHGTTYSSRKQLGEL